MRFLIIFALGLFFTGCYEGKVDPPAADSGDTAMDDNGEDDAGTDDIDCDNAFGFAADIAPISEANCDSCHPSQSSPDTQTFAGWQEKIGNIITRLEITGPLLMPQGGPALSSNQIAGIKLWSECDFPE